MPKKIFIESGFITIASYFFAQDNTSILGHSDRALALPQGVAVRRRERRRQGTTCLPLHSEQRMSDCPNFTSRMISVLNF